MSFHSTEPGPLLYVYAIVSSGSAASELLGRRTVTGISGGELFAIEAGSLVAAVSEVPAVDFDEEPLNELLRDLNRLAPLAVRHEEAIRALLPGAPALIPMTFGTVYRSAAGIARMLKERGDEFRSLLAHLDRRQEWGVRVVQDTAVAMTAAEDADDIRDLDAEIARATPGHAYLFRKRRAALLRDHAANREAATMDAIVARLGEVSVEWRAYSIVRDDADPTPLLWRAAFLVETRSVDRFRREADSLARSYRDQGYHLTVDGPWAPYSFVGRRSGGA
jgi:hypothetical protein